VAVREELPAAGVRAELDSRNEKLGYRIREAQLQKVPYMLVVGAREQEEGTIAVRRRVGEDLGALAVPAFLERVDALVAARGTDL